MNKNTKNVVLTVVLIIAVACSLYGCGKNVATDTESNAQDTIVDTIAPKVTMKQRYIFTNDISDAPIGKIYYGLMLYPNGCAVDDLLVYKRGVNDFFLVINHGFLHYLIKRRPPSFV